MFCQTCSRSSRENQFGYVSAPQEEVWKLPPQWDMLESAGEARTGWVAIWARTAACLRILSSVRAPAWAAAVREIIVLSLLQAPCLLLVQQTGPFMRQEESRGTDEVEGWIKRLERGCWESGLGHWTMSFYNDSCAGRWEAVFRALFCGGGSQSGGCINLYVVHVHTCVCQRLPT